MVRGQRRAADGLAVRAWHKIAFREQWYLHLDRLGYDPGNMDLAGGFDLVPPLDRFWADPFLCVKDGRKYLFVEELLFASKRGHISAIEFTDSGQIVDCRSVLREPWHLSYPFIFEWNSGLWMVPESHQSGKLTIYRCEHFPDKWVKERDLMTGVCAADPTIFEHQGRWWLFMTVAINGRGLNNRLCAFYGTTPLGPFRAHARNPIVSEARGGRPAGAPIQYNGSLLRPAQDCSRLYGERIVLQEVIALTPDTYVEVERQTIEPAWKSGALRTHHISVRQNWRVLDVLRRVRRLGKFQTARTSASDGY